MGSANDAIKAELVVLEGVVITVDVIFLIDDLLLWWSLLGRTRVPLAAATMAIAKNISDHRFVDDISILARGIGDAVEVVHIITATKALSKALSKSLGLSNSIALMKHVGEAIIIVSTTVIAFSKAAIDRAAFRGRVAGDEGAQRAAREADRATAEAIAQAIRGATQRALRLMHAVVIRAPATAAMAAAAMSTTAGRFHFFYSDVRLLILALRADQGIELPVQVIEIVEIARSVAMELADIRGVAAAKNIEIGEVARSAIMELADIHGVAAAQDIELALRPKTLVIALELHELSTGTKWESPIERTMTTLRVLRQNPIITSAATLAATVRATGEVPSQINAAIVAASVKVRRDFPPEASSAAIGASGTIGLAHLAEPAINLGPEAALAELQRNNENATATAHSREGLVREDVSCELDRAEARLGPTRAELKSKVRAALQRHRCISALRKTKRVCGVSVTSGERIDDHGLLRLIWKSGAKGGSIPLPFGVEGNPMAHEILLICRLTSLLQLQPLHLLLRRRRAPGLGLDGARLYSYVIFTVS